MGANAKAKANAAAAIPELIQIATNPSNGWYKYDIQFALPVYENELLIRYHVFSARLLRCV